MHAHNIVQKCACVMVPLLTLYNTVSIHANYIPIVTVAIYNNIITMIPK